MVGCQVYTPDFEVTVYQVDGAQQAANSPEEEAWAAPFTWLNVNFNVKKPLATPVTGILGTSFHSPQKAARVRPSPFIFSA